MEEIKDADACESLCNDVGQPAGGGVCVHLAETEGAVVDLGESVDDDEDVGDVEAVGVPEEHPC